MKIENVDLYSYFKINKSENADGRLTCYVHEEDPTFNGTMIRPAMIVLAGGAYTHVSPRETEPIALKYFAEGFNCFVLNYSVRPVSFPVQLIEGCGAVIYLKENAEKLRIHKDKVCLIGFSAGGHLASCIATMSEDEIIKEVFKERSKLAKPDACIYAYSVFSSQFSNASSVKILCNNDEELIKYCSTDERVKKDTPPAFFWATVSDKSVTVLNTLLMATAYKKNEVPFEMHLFENGCHGLSIATTETAIAGQENLYCIDDVAKWFEMSLNFLRRHEFIMKK